MSVLVELRGLEVFGHHGVLPAERERGQSFWYDVALTVGDEALDDRIEGTVDYREVASKVREVSAARAYNLIEALAGAVADALIAAFPVEHVRVTVRKRPNMPVEETRATVERPRS
jgi:dihydroneopterin aldolase